MNDNQTLYEVVLLNSDGPATEASTGKKSGGPSHAEIVAIAICSTCVFIMLIAIFLVWMRRKMKQNIPFGNRNHAEKNGPKGPRQRRESEFRVTSGSGRRMFYVNDKGKIIPVKIFKSSAK